MRTIRRRQIEPIHRKVVERQEFITKDEVARRLKRTERTIEAWQRSGVIPYVKLGRSVLYNWNDVFEHLNKNFRVCRNHPLSRN